MLACEDTILRRGSPDTEDIKYGFEGGRVVKIGNTYHMITSEMVGDPYCVRMRTGATGLPRTGRTGAAGPRSASRMPIYRRVAARGDLGPMMVYHKRQTVASLLRML